MTDETSATEPGKDVSEKKESKSIVNSNEDSTKEARMPTKVNLLLIYWSVIPDIYIIAHSLAKLLKSIRIISGCRQKIAVINE